MQQQKQKQQEHIPLLCSYSHDDGEGSTCCSSSGNENTTKLPQAQSIPVQLVYESHSFDNNDDNNSTKENHYYNSNCGSSNCGNYTSCSVSSVNNSSCHSRRTIQSAWNEEQQRIRSRGLSFDCEYLEYMSTSTANDDYDEDEASFADSSVLSLNSTTSRRSVPGMKTAACTSTTSHHRQQPQQPKSNRTPRSSNRAPNSYCKYHPLEKQNADDNNSVTTDTDMESSCMGMLSHNDHQQQQQQSNVKSTSSGGGIIILLICIVGIYASFLMYGNVQEVLFLYRSPTDGSAFTAVWLLQVLESTASIILGLFGTFYLSWSDKGCATSTTTAGSETNSHDNHPQRKPLPVRSLFYVGTTQVVSRGLVSLALSLRVSFPVCTLAKSGKIVPVMIGQILLGGSRYSLRDYSFCLLIVTGVTLVTLGEENTSSILMNSYYSSSIDDDPARGHLITGIVCLLLSLFLDGCTAGIQKHMAKGDGKYRTPTMYDFLLYSHLSMWVVGFVIMVCTKELVQGIEYIIDNPTIRKMLVQVCFCSVIGQGFIFYTITQFDTYVCTTITTTRKLVSVVMSIIIHGHILSQTGYFGLFVSFSAILIEIINSKRPSK